MRDKETMALYIRLSDEDGDVQAVGEKRESNSVANQRALLQGYYRDHAELHRYELREFCDDGYTGTNFDRPRFQAMMEQVRRREVRCIMVKDLSRFGREYLEVGGYLELILPLFGTRFISVNDGFDSADYAGTTGGLELALRNLINGMYSLDLSNKVRSALKTRNRQGKYWGGFGFYGYLPSPGDKHKLVVDEAVRPVVRRIFDLCISGRSTAQIAGILNEEGIPCPAAYKKRRGMKYNGRIVEDEPVWLRTSVKQILKDERYTGKMITGTRESEGIRCNKMRNLPEDQWTVINGAHEAIVPEETFLAAREAMRSRIRNTNRDTAGSRKDNLYVCGYCGRKLQKSGGKETYLVCPKARTVPGAECARIHENQTLLQEKTLQVIRAMAAAMLEKSQIHRATAGSTTGKLQNEIAQLAAQIERLQNGKLDLYEEYRSGKLTRERFMEIQSGNQLKVDGLKKALETKREQMRRMEEDARQVKDVSRQAQEIWVLSGYRPEVIRRLVERIKVFDGGRVELELRCRSIVQGGVLSASE